MNHSILENDMQMITGAHLPWERFANKTILVSGANGFLPAYMIETLLYLNIKKNYNIKILGLVRNLSRARERFKKYENSQHLHLFQQDVTQFFSIDEKLDFIIHAASQASPKYYGIDPVGTLSANVLGTHYLLEIAKAHQCEDFLFFSSGEVYGEVNSDSIPTSEHMYGYVDPLNVRSCYAEGKRMGENMCVSYAHQFGLSVKIIRPFHIYGPGLRLDDGRVFSDFVADIINNRDIVLHGDGTAVRAFCYLADATLGFFTVLLMGKNLEAYNIGNSDNAITIEALATRLSLLFHEKNIKVKKIPGLVQSGYIPSKISINCPDISKTRALGWHPSIAIEEGFLKTVESFYEVV